MASIGLPIIIKVRRNDERLAYEYIITLYLLFNVY